MAKITKTYGVLGLMDWQPILHVGKAKFQPLFEGGGATAYGETPAKYTTSNPILQHIIESSHYFKVGHIQLLYSNTTDDGSGIEEEGDKTTNEAEVTGAETTDAEAEESGEAMDFASTGDAAQYLADNFDIPKSQLRGRSNVVTAAKEHGIIIKFTE